MIKIEKTETFGWEAAIRGMRNPMNSWDKSDSYNSREIYDEDDFNEAIKNTLISPNCKCSNRIYVKGIDYIVGDNDLDLMKRLRNAGTDHRKFMRMITVYCDITAPLYWWKEFDTYKVGTVANSCSTMHKIAEKPFTLDDFSHEHIVNDELFVDSEVEFCSDIPHQLLCKTIGVINAAREQYIETNCKKYWWQMIQLLPSSYNQKRTVMMNYEVLANIYKSRKNHKLDEWYEFRNWIESLPYSDLITGE